MRYWKFTFFSLFLTFLVKGFSRVVFSLALFNFQDAASLNPHQATYLLYHISLSLSSTFLNFFKKFFKTFYVTVTALCGNFYIISHIFRFVKYFFQFFQEIFCKLSFRSPKNILSKIPCFSLPPRPTALLLYHAISQKSSRSISYFSDVFCRISTKH